MNPFRAPIHLPTLRRSLFRCDRLPADTQARFFPAVALLDWRGESALAAGGPARLPVRVLGQERTAPLPGFRPRKLCKHRVQVECPVCCKWIPAGRAHQHGRAHQ